MEDSTKGCSRGGEKMILGIVMALTTLLGFCMLSGYFPSVLSIPFCLLGLFAAGILMRDEKNLKWGSILLFLILIYAVAVAVWL